MDEIALLRKVHEDVPPPGLHAVEAGRQALVERIRGESRSGPRITRRAMVVGGAGAAVLGVAAVSIVASPTAPAADAADVLHRAADRAASTPLIEAGTVIEIRRRGLESAYASGGSDADVVARREIVTLTRIPEPGRPWLRKRAEISYEYVYGDEALLPQDMQPVPTDSPQYWGFESSELGTFVNDPRPRSEAGLGEYPAEIQDLPRDPDRLLQALEADGAGPAAGTGWEVLGAAEIVLTSGVADGELRAAVFRALLRMPDLAIVDEHASDLDGRVGVAIGVKPGTPDPSGDHVSVQLLIDPATGEYLGGRAMSLRRDGLVPAGVEISADSVRFDVATTAADWTPPEGNRFMVYP